MEVQGMKADGVVGGMDADGVGEIFHRIQAMPYATNAAHDAAALRLSGRGDCVAKSQLLAQELSTIGAQTRIVRWTYRIPHLVAARSALLFDTDIHTSVQVLSQGQWLLVDATHDPPLATLGLTVSHWQPGDSTAPAYPPLSPIWVMGDPADDSAYATALTEIAARVAATPQTAVDRYRDELNLLLDTTRNPHPA